MVRKDGRERILRKPRESQSSLGRIGIAAGRAVGGRNAACAAGHVVALEPARGHETSPIPEKN